VPGGDVDVEVGGVADGGEFLARRAVADDLGDVLAVESPGGPGGGCFG
jgi:hypothetical protein